jgi:hypothetical protein
MNSDPQPEISDERRGPFGTRLASVLAKWALMRSERPDVSVSQYHPYNLPTYESSLSQDPNLGRIGTRETEPASKGASA